MNSTLTYTSPSGDSVLVDAVLSYGLFGDEVSLMVRDSRGDVRWGLLSEFTIWNL